MITFQSITNYLIMLFVSKWAALIPMVTLARILVVVTYKMSEWESFATVLKGPKSDVAVLLTTFFLTVAVDLIVAIEIGMILAAFLFVRKMIKFSEVRNLSIELDDKEDALDNVSIDSYKIPERMYRFLKLPVRYFLELPLNLRKPCDL